MRVSNGTMCKIIMYRINCTSYVIIMFIFLYFPGKYLNMYVLYIILFIFVLTNCWCSVEINTSSINATTIGLLPLIFHCPCDQEAIFIPEVKKDCFV